MSRQRAERRRHRRSEERTRRRVAVNHSDYFGMMVAWCDGTVANIKEAQATTHDALLAQMGNRRTGGVAWRIYDAAEGRVVVERLIETADVGDTAIRGYYRRLLALLREHDGNLVVAYAPGRRT